MNGKRPRDANQRAKDLAEIATGQVEAVPPLTIPSPCFCKRMVARAAWPKSST